ncbi:hypothetical protein F2Q69_00061162 [Brassica cretica]|uniref:Protein kinase domain-containing protein n=1 Tax=Brassica cretica TaxID=69181 RepID=A0A8S9RG71_BRACR|nr:hypothetical protein F2Q69_00061162 [Brassica cretica]
MKVHGVFLVAVFFYLAYTQLISGQPLKDCQTSCGNVTVEYPFGTSPGCYYADDPSFKLTCSDKEKLFFRRNLEVINISHSGELRGWNNISYTCYNSQGNVSTYRHKSYMFNVVGCNALALLSTFGTQNYSTGCLSACDSPPAVNGDCNGAGQMSLTRWFPLVLDWSFGNQTCEQVGNKSICSMSNSLCFNSTRGTGYNCKCLEGFEGNPYLSNEHGCRDINECTSTIHKHNCSDPSTCRNKDGGFYCKCKSGYRLDTTNMSCKRKDFGWATILLGTTIGFLSILLVVSCVQQRMKHRKTAELRQKFFQQNGGGMLMQRLSGGGTSNYNIRIFTEEGMKEATNGYEESRILGQGGQGTVYKGILPDNSIVAIKKARLGDNSQVEQFINEVLVLSQINHRNVVKLLGCCLETEVPLLVYEFINSGTLSDHLHGSLFGPSLTWEHRLRIAVEIAGTLAYLHSSASIPIVHRDVKTANILLDKNLTAKVADFGASRLIPMDKEQLTTMVQGTLGYLDPEYYNTGLLNEKSDVYSFGVVLMELLSGQKALCFERPQQSKHLVNYVASAMKENRLHEVIDVKVMTEDNNREIKEVARIAVECTRLMGEERPKMKEVAAELEGLRVAKAKHQWSDQYPEETEHLVGVQIISAQGDSSSIGYDSIKNVARLHIEAGR